MSCRVDQQEHNPEVIWEAIIFATAGAVSSADVRSFSASLMVDNCKERKYNSVPSEGEEALLARRQDDKQAERQKLEEALTLFTELKMPRQRDAVRAELDKTPT